jgi:uncharacterized protein YjbJ (UPF0337 family)
MLDVLVGSWNQLRGPIKGWWSKLTDDDLDSINGKYDRLVNVLEKKYNYSPQRAKDEVNRRLAEFEKGHRA